MIYEKDQRQCRAFNRRLRFAIQAMFNSGMRKEMLAYLKSEFGNKEKPLSWETLEHLLYTNMRLNAAEPDPPIYEAHNRLIDLLIIVTEKGT